MLNGNELGDAIWQAIQALPADRRNERELWRTIGRAIVNYLAGNAEVIQVVISPGIPVQVSPSGTGATTGQGIQQGSGRLR